jgi:hypothetical protein
VACEVSAEHKRDRANQNLSLLPGIEQRSIERKLVNRSSTVGNKLISVDEHDSSTEIIFIRFKETRRARARINVDRATNVIFYI